MFVHVVKAEQVKDCKVRPAFNDGVDGMVDLSAELHGEAFRPLRDLECFRSFALQGQAFAWRNGAGFAPEFPHGKVAG